MKNAEVTIKIDHNYKTQLYIFTLSIDYTPDGYDRILVEDTRLTDIEHIDKDGNLNTVNSLLDCPLEVSSELERRIENNMFELGEEL